MKTKKSIEEIIELGDVNAKLEDGLLSLNKDGNEVTRRLTYEAKLENGKIILRKDNPNKRDKKLIRTNAAHIRSLISGLKEKYVYELQVASVHFPVTVSVVGQELVVKNFLGEVKDRKAKILEGVEVKVDKDKLTVKSFDKEKAGQTAANIETATKIRNRDRRVFQDGIFIIKKEKGARKR